MVAFPFASSVRCSTTRDSPFSLLSQYPHVSHCPPYGNFSRFNSPLSQKAVPRHSIAQAQPKQGFSPTNQVSASLPLRQHSTTRSPRPPSGFAPSSMPDTVSATLQPCTLHKPPSPNPGAKNFHLLRMARHPRLIRGLPT